MITVVQYINVKNVNIKLTSVCTITCMNYVYIVNDCSLGKELNQISSLLSCNVDSNFISSTDRSHNVKTDTDVCKETKQMEKLFNLDERIQLGNTLLLKCRNMSCCMYTSMLHVHFPATNHRTITDVKSGVTLTYCFMYTNLFCIHHSYIALRPAICYISNNNLILVFLMPQSASCQSLLCIPICYMPPLDYTPVSSCPCLLYAPVCNMPPVCYTPQFSMLAFHHSKYNYEDGCFYVTYYLCNCQHFSITNSFPIHVNFLMLYPHYLKHS